MEVNAVHSHRRLFDKTPVGTVRPQKKRQKKSRDKERGLKQLVRLINVKKIAFGNKEHTTDQKMGVSVLLRLFISSNEV